MGKVIHLSDYRRDDQGRFAETSREEPQRSLHPVSDDSNFVDDCPDDPGNLLVADPNDEFDYRDCHTAAEVWDRFFEMVVDAERDTQVQHYHSAMQRLRSL